MAEWEVTLPVVGSLSLVVEAESEKEAIEKAFEVGYDPKDQDLTWETVERVTRGDVLYAPVNSASAIKVAD